MSGSIGGSSLTLTWDGDTSDLTPDFTLSGLTDPVVGDVVRLVFDGDNYDNTLDAAEVADLACTLATGNIPAGTYSAYAIHLQSAVEVARSNTVTVTIVDATAPTVSAVTGTTVSDTTGSGTFNTNEANGTFYWVVSTSSTRPSNAQIIAGQMHTGAAAADSGSQTVSATGSQAITGGFTGLTPSTAYYAHGLHVDISGNASTGASSSVFTTNAANPITYIDTYVNNVGYASTSTSFNVDFGTITGTKVAVIAVLARYSSATEPTMTVDGNAATRVTGGNSVSNSQQHFFTRSLSSGGTLTVTVTGAALLADVAICVWLLDGLAAAATGTDRAPHGFRGTGAVTLFDGSTGNGTGTQSIPSGGAGLVMTVSNDSGAITFSGTGMTTHESVYDAGTGLSYGSGSSPTDVDPVPNFTSFTGDTHIMAAFGP